jgi:hypothetical protein
VPSPVSPNVKPVNWDLLLKNAPIATGLSFTLLRVTTGIVPAVSGSMKGFGSKNEKKK